MPWKNLSNALLLPELELIAFKSPKYSWTRYFVEKRSKMEVCPRCATPSTSIYDHRSVVVKDSPIRGQMIFLEIKTLRCTLMKWKEEILNYFLTGLTNGRTEGYNNLAKLVQKRAFGYTSFRNYRLRLLNSCA